MKLKRVHLNLLVDLAIGVAFLVEAASGFVLWVVLPRGGYQGGRGLPMDKTWLLTRNSWLSMHDWGSVVIVLGVLIHIALHWRWFVCVIRKLFHDLGALSASKETKECAL